MLHVPPTSSFLILSPKQHWVRSLSSSLCSLCPCYNLSSPMLQTCLRS
jgi:hypothetical protein